MDAGRFLPSQRFVTSLRLVIDHMGLDQKIRERAKRVTRLLVEGQTVNPWLVGIDVGDTFSTRSLELRLGIPILMFELKQSEVSVTKEDLIQFVLDDIKNHQNQALDGYLTIVRYVDNPPPRRKSYNWLARMFISLPSWTPPQPQWKWTSVSSVALGDEDTLVISGACTEAGRPSQ